MMHKHPIALLGVSFDNATLDEAAQKVAGLTNLHARDHINRYVCTINVDFMAKAHTLSWNNILNPELLDIYRRSNFVCCDGTPLIWLSRLLGSPLQGRVPGVDLIPKLAALLSQSNKSLFLLGGGEQINKVTGVILEAMNPGLRIAGRASPRVFTEGEDLLNANEQDTLLIEEINRAAPDVLLIAFGNPKQEKWFDRVRERLNVPISIGVGGSFDIISGAVSRAPVWMQNVGLEWVYRLMQEPGRMWKRYFVDIWKFFGISIPLVCYHATSALLFRLFRKREAAPADHPLLFLSDTQTIAMIPLPPLVDEEYCHLVYTHLEETFNQDTVILDFADVRHITLEGFSLLLKIWLKAERSGKELYAMNVSGDTKLLMKVHRIWDLVKDSVMNNPEQVLRALIQGNSHPDFFDSVQQNGDHVAVYFFGRIGAGQNDNGYIDGLAPILREKDSILDFRYCTYIDNAGFSFLLRLKRIVEMKGRSLKVRNRSRNLQRQFALSDVEELFTVP